MALVKCCECGSDVSDQANACPKCGAPPRKIDSQAAITPLVTTTSVATSPEEKKVGLLLGLGVFLIPFIFAWLLLRKGYSTRARILGFAWMGLFIYAKASDTYHKAHRTPQEIAVDQAALEKKQAEDAQAKAAQMAADNAKKAEDDAKKAEDEKYKAVKEDVFQLCSIYIRTKENADADIKIGGRGTVWPIRDPSGKWATSIEWTATNAFGVTVHNQTICAVDSKGKKILGAETQTLKYEK